MAAHAESVSNHPIARSVVEAYKETIDKGTVESFQELSGLGIEARIKGQHVLVGSARFLKNQGINVSDAVHGTGVYVAIDRQYAGVITIVDHPKPDEPTLCQVLKSWGSKYYYAYW